MNNKWSMEKIPQLSGIRAVNSVSIYSSHVTGITSSLWMNDVNFSAIFIPILTLSSDWCPHCSSYIDKLVQGCSVSITTAIEIPILLKSIDIYVMKEKSHPRNPGDQEFYTRSPFYDMALTLIPAWISNYIHYKLWYEITYPFSNLNSAAVKVWEWISNVIFTLYWAYDYLSMLGLKLIHVSKRTLDNW